MRSRGCPVKTAQAPPTPPDKKLRRAEGGLEAAAAGKSSDVRYDTSDRTDLRPADFEIRHLPFASASTAVVEGKTIGELSSSDMLALCCCKVLKREHNFNGVNGDTVLDDAQGFP
jgi:hypothetical protein